MNRRLVPRFALMGTLLLGPTVAQAQFLRPRDIDALPSRPADARIAYGRDSLQFGDLRLPVGRGPFPVAVVIHGGCWQHGLASLQNSAALSDALRDAGVATWNVEYRRYDNPGGGWPGTFLDVAVAADSLRSIAKRYPLDLTRVVSVGHSAGGHLALWLAARNRLKADSPLRIGDPLPLVAAISLGGPGDLRDFSSYGDPICGERVIQTLLGGDPEVVPDRWAQGSPVQLLPLGVRQLMIAGESDRIMPQRALEAYAAAVRAKGGDIDVIRIPGAAHFEVMAPTTAAWPIVRDAIVKALTPGRPVRQGQTPPAGQGPETTSARWWNDVKALSHDSMAGRQTGSAEHRKAAEFVAAAFTGAGLTPAGTAGFFQPVALLSRTIDEGASSLTLVRNGHDERVSLGTDAAFQVRAPLATGVDAPLIYAGYGLRLPEFGVDDLTGLDLKGKIVVYSTAMPKGVPGPVISHSRAQAWETFRRAGAVGMIVLVGSTTDSAAFMRAAAGRLAPQMTLNKGALDSQRGNRLSLAWNAASAEKLFGGAPERYAAIAARADSGLPLPHFDLPVRLRSTVKVVTRPIVSDNVIGLLRGHDPVLRNEYVVITAHLDHVGVGRAVNGDSIYNGAMDNASGTALLMETARRLHDSGARLRRSLLFVAVTAEEKGLLGSRYFANHPTVPARRIVADLNTDMFMPIIPFSKVMVNGLEESNLADDAVRAAHALGVTVVSDPEPEENRFIRSDQYSFILRGIPSLSFKVGFALGTPEHEAVKEFRAKRYHFPQDDIDQHVDQATAEGFTRFYLSVVTEVANREVRAQWNRGSIFGRRTTQP